MKRFALTLTVLFLTAACTARAADKPKQVRAAGCVAHGVEAGCLTLKDAKTGTLYNLLFKGPKPQADTGIQFTGTLHEGVTMCMQGAAVEVTQWEHADGLRCVPSEAPKE